MCNETVRRVRTTLLHDAKANVDTSTNGMVLLMPALHFAEYIA